MRKFRFIFSFLLVCQLAFGQFLTNPYVYGSLLDNYPSAAAYSLVKLRTGYTGFVALGRASTTSAEGYIAFDGNAVSMNSSVSVTVAGTSGLSVGQVVTLTTFCNSGGANLSVYAKELYDQSGNGNTLTQTNTANQPRIVNAGSLETINSVVALRFLLASTTYIQRTSALSALDAGNNATMVVIANNLTANTFSVAFDNNGDFNIRIPIDRGVNKRGMVVQNTGATAYTSDMPAQLDNSDLRLSFNVIKSTKDFTNWTDGTASTTGTYTGTYGNSAICLGARYSYYTQLLDGYISAFIVFPQDYTTERAIIENNLKSIFGTP